MKCWHCNNELIWGSDHDFDEEEDHHLWLRGGELAQTIMVTYLTCPNEECQSLVEVFKPDLQVLELEAS
tara:strand:- start:50 stop:256 length:207 start_codon:yes stop_codon:yes gene_type:complete